MCQKNLLSSPLTHIKFSRSTKNQWIPPIVKNIKNFQLLCSQLNKITGSGSYSCISRTYDTKISPNTADCYRKIVKYLTETKADYHTYQLRQERALRVVIRNLHPSTPAEVIEDELRSSGFKVRQITNVLKDNKDNPGSKNKIPLPLFFVDLEPSPGIEKIYDINRLYHTCVKVEKPYPKREIVQCHNCQAYGHTKRYCHHLPRCVKCGEQHKSGECTRPKQTPAVCALCLEGHPASYKGCQVYKNLKLRYKKPPGQGETNAAGPRREPSKIVNSTTSYAQLLGGVSENNTSESLPQQNIPQHPQPQTQHPISQHLPIPPQTHSHPISHVPPPSNATDLTTLLTSFLSEFKSLVNPLISLLTNLVSHFIPPLKNP